MVPQKEAALSCANVLNRNIALSKKNMKVCRVCLHGCMGACVRASKLFFFFCKDTKGDTCIHQKQQRGAARSLFSL